MDPLVTGLPSPVLSILWFKVDPLTQVLFLNVKFSIQTSLCCDNLFVPLHLFCPGHLKFFSTKYLFFTKPFLIAISILHCTLQIKVKLQLQFLSAPITFIISEILEAVGVLSDLTSYLLSIGLMGWMMPKGWPTEPTELYLSAYWNVAKSNARDKLERCEGRGGKRHISIFPG